MRLFSVLTLLLATPASATPAATSDPVNLEMTPLTLQTSPYLASSGAYGQRPGYYGQQPGYHAPGRGATRYSRYRTRWYIGFGVGGGAGTVTTDSGDQSRTEGGVALIFKVGGVVTPWLLVGFEGSAWRYQATDDSWVQFNHYDVMATVFPIFDVGLYGKAGVGAGIAMVGFGSSLGRATEVGFDLKAGGGYEFQIGRTWTIGFDLTYGLTAYDGGKTHDFCGNLTFTWY